MNKKFLILPLLASSLQGQTLIDNFSALTNDRFANDSSFIGSAFDFSGVGRTTQGPWATLIADNVFLSSEHFPAAGAVTFYEGNSPTSVSHTRTVAGGMQIGATDLYIGYFNSNLPATIARYDFATFNLNTAATSLIPVSPQLFAYTAGASPTTTGYGSSSLTNMAVGENRLEFYQQDTVVNTGGITDTIFTLQNEPGDAGYTYETYESALSGGDSGSPLLIPTGGGLELWGIASGNGIYTLPSGEERPISGYSYLGNYDEEIQSYIDNNFVGLPEPSTILLLAGGGLFLLRKRRT